MDLAPANLLLANAEQELIFAEQREFRLKDILSPFLNSYDFILVDCPPSLGILSQISLVASTHVLVPVQCQYKALLGTEAGRHFDRLYCRHLYVPGNQPQHLLSTHSPPIV